MLKIYSIGIVNNEFYFTADLPTEITSKMKMRAQDGCLVAHHHVEIYTKTNRLCRDEKGDAYLSIMI